MFLRLTQNVYISSTIGPNQPQYKNISWFWTGTTNGIYCNSKLPKGDMLYSTIKLKQTSIGNLSLFHEKNVKGKKKKKKKSSMSYIHKSNRINKKNNINNTKSKQTIKDKQTNKNNNNFWQIITLFNSFHDSARWYCLVLCFP